MFVITEVVIIEIRYINISRSRLTIRKSRQCLPKAYEDEGPIKVKIKRDSKGEKNMKLILGKRGIE